MSVTSLQTAFILHEALIYGWDEKSIIFHLSYNSNLALEAWRVKRLKQFTGRKVSESGINKWPMWICQYTFYVINDKLPGISSNTSFSCKQVLYNKILKATLEYQEHQQNEILQLQEQSTDFDGFFLCQRHHEAYTFSNATYIVALCGIISMRVLHVKISLFKIWKPTNQTQFFATLLPCEQKELWTVDKK